MDYLKNLKRIAEIGQYQFILATHSPQIFDYKWSYTIDLYKQTTNDAERSVEHD
jgi:predicted ATPase